MIRLEEEAFLKTIQRGLQRFAAAVETAEESKADTITADVAFQLHDTYGFPIDLTRVMATERGMQVDMEGYERLMESARETSRSGDQDADTMTLPPDALAKLEHMQVAPTDDDPKYGAARGSATIKAIWNGRGFCERTTDCEDAGLVLDRTNFYAEQGGQVSDTGRILDDTANSARFNVQHVQRFGDYVLHRGRSSDRPLAVGDRLMLHVDEERRGNIESHHTVTHLLNHALRTTLGTEVEQRGSLVADDRLRFDFLRCAMTSELAEVEVRVQNAINAESRSMRWRSPSPKRRRSAARRAVFGERIRIRSGWSPSASRCSCWTVRSTRRGTDTPSSSAAPISIGRTGGTSSCSNRGWPRECDGSPR